MLSAEQLEAEYYQRLIAQQREQDRKKFFNPERDIDLERVWVAYVWDAAKDTPHIGEWKLAGFRRRRNRRKPQTLNRFFSKVRRKLGLDKKAPVMLYDLASALKQVHAKDQSWRTRPPQFQRRVTKMPQITPVIDRKKRKLRAKQRAHVFNPKKTKYIALGRHSIDKRRPGYLYLGPLTSDKKRSAQFEAKRLFPLWDDRLVIATSELSKPLRAALVRNRRVRAGVTRLQWPEVPPSFDKMWEKVARHLVKKEFDGAIDVDDPGLLDARDELHKMWEAQKCPWLTTKWFRTQINSWSESCEKINVAKLLPRRKIIVPLSRGTVSRKRSNGKSRRVKVIAKRLRTVRVPLVSRR